jgi:hypothetical protein
MTDTPIFDDGDDDVPEISWQASQAIESWRRILEHTAGDKTGNFERGAAELTLLAAQEPPASRSAIIDSLYFMGQAAGLSDDETRGIIARVESARRVKIDNAEIVRLINGPSERANNDGTAFDEAPPPDGLGDYYSSNGKTTEPDDETAFGSTPPLTIEEWLARDLPAPDFIMGSWLSTTTRGLLVGPTGLGKTNLALALALYIAAGKDFLHWRGQKPCKVLYVDGEMSRRLFRQRIEDAVARLGERPAGFYALSHEDVEKFAPLNSAAGQAYIERLIAQIGPDFIVFDSIMCLLTGDMKEGESWSAVMPWVRSLTRRQIGQLWLHHTGHDESRSYGDKTKEWQLDLVMHMDAVAREDTDVSFNLEFRKARERTPATRANFQTARIALVADQWTVDVPAAVRPGHVSPVGLKFLDALHNALATDAAVLHHGRRAVTLEHWKAECFVTGLLDRDKSSKQVSALWSKYRLELIAANHIACDDAMAWTI